MSMFGDWSGVGNWWNQAAGNVGTFLKDVVRASAASPGNPRAAVPSTMRTPANLQRNATPVDNSALDRAYRNQMAEAARLGGRGNLQNLIGQEMMSRQPQGPDQSQLAQDWITQMLGLAYGQGGGGPNLSGFDTMLGDLTAREGALGTRRGEQEAFLADLFSAAQGRMTTDREALASAIQSQLESDAARRAQEVGLIRGEDAERLATANAAREQLGVEGGEDLSSAVAQNAVAGVGAGGSVAERDARIRESIQNQQIQSQIAGLVPMEQMARSDLSRGFEDRLAQLASERAAIQAQRAQAAASYRRPTPSISELLQLDQAAAQRFGLVEEPGVAPKLPSNATGLDVLNYYSQMNQGNAGLYASVFNRMPQLLRGYGLDPVTMKPQERIQVANDIVSNNPGLEPAYDFILSWLQTAQ